MQRMHGQPLFLGKCANHVQNMCSPFLAKRKDAKSFDLTSFIWCTSRVTGRFQPTIFGTSELNFCVRNGNRWDLTVIDTGYVY